MSAAHKITARGNSAVARGYRIGRSRLQTGSSRLQMRPDPRRIKGLETAREPFVVSGTANARVRSFARRVHFSDGVGWLQTVATRRNPVIAADLKELGYGG